MASWHTQRLNRLSVAGRGASLSLDLMGVDMVGQRFTRWLVLSFKGFGKRRSVVKWNCICDCGNQRVVDGSSLRGGKTKSCGCFRDERVSATKRLRPYESLYHCLTARCRHKGMECSLTYEQFVDFTLTPYCHYCGVTVPWTLFNVQANRAACNLDRIDNSIGYSVANCVVCCETCNAMKSGLSYSAFVAQVARIHERTKWTTVLCPTSPL